MGVLLAALLAADTVLVLPFATKADARAGAGVAVAEVILDVVVQANRDNFLTLKQLDAALRRRDLQLDDAAVCAHALELARPLGATDVVLGEVRLEGGQWRIEAKRLKVASGKLVKQAAEEGARAAFPTLAHKVAFDLFERVRGSPGPLTRSGVALEEAALCEAQLARQPLGPRARTALAPDRIASAEKACKAALQADPMLGLARAGLAVALAARGKFAQAREQARKAQSRRFVPIAVLAESFAERKMHGGKDSRAILERAMIARHGFLHALGYLAEDRMEQGDDEAALAIFDRYLQLSPDHPWAMGMKGRELARLGRIDEAIEISERALELDPGDPELLIETASRYIDAGRDARAQPLLEQCLRLATRDEEARTRGMAHADLAIVHARQERYADAVAELERARAEGNNELPCDEPELEGWKDQPELREVCVAAEAALADSEADDDAVPVEL